jgi:DNA processing protein
MRNAVMSAYAKASLVIQADERSGARLQARIAAEQGRAVYLYEPIMKHEAWAQGMVDKGKALFIQTAQEIV